ncbi:TRAPP II complex, Trs120 [Artemisia annua]|uniref:TRAPP II complex, Trs120 n=1 Tax=Artemisia annua TaxID=35608 RepID=A0A2U1P1R6_ARTAN|nr:TRAPP II complex, Trs120 [Artemisia annua]
MRRLGSHQIVPCVPSPFPLFLTQKDFQSSRKVHGVIGICHCPSSPDLDVVVEEFGSLCKGYSFAVVKRCFALAPGDTQVVVTLIANFYLQDRQARHAKCHFIAIDIFNGKKLGDIVPSSHNCDVQFW